MLRRLKNLIELSKLDVTRDKDGIVTISNPEPLGDGKAEFLNDMTEEEMIDYQHEEVQGWAKLKKRLGL